MNMKNILVLMFAIFSITQTYASNDMVVCTMDAKMCSDWSWVWRSWPNCEFICPWDEVKKEEPKACTREYMPVCGEIQIQCIKAPCYPIKQTFWNKCELESNSLAIYLYNWECLSEKLETKINSAWSDATNKYLSKLDFDKKVSILEKAITKIDKMIENYPTKQNILWYIKNLISTSLLKN